MFQESEIISLILALVSISLFAFVFKKMKLPRLGLLYIGFFFVLCGYLLTIIKGLLWHDFFNLLEHLCYAVSGVFFAAGCLAIMQNSTYQQEQE